MYFKTFDKKDCSGCTACISVCPKQCIKMQQDEEGFHYPIIDKTECIKCGLCEKTCPFHKPLYENTDIPRVYACYVKSIEQRQKSTSGGVFYSIAKTIIDKGGIVYGAAFDDNFKLHHIGVENISDLEKLRGSKYLQSDMGNVFKEIKLHLKNNRWVYFVGCGCQVAGLNAFLRKKYNTLITSDLVCHGVPSQKMFDWHLDYLREKEKGIITEYVFRDYSGWGGCEKYKYKSSKGEGEKINHTYFLSPYLYSFMYGLVSRYSCYNCKFARLPRQGDITLADYWGAKLFFPDLDVSKGVSLVLINNSKAVVLWDEVKDYLEYKISNLDDALKYNKNLINKTELPVNREKYYKLILERGYKSVAENEFRAKNYRTLKFKNYIKTSKIWNIVNRIIRLF